MKMDFMFLLSAFAIQGAFDGEENKAAKLLQSLGFSADDLAKIEAGELSLEDAKSQYTQSFETSIRGRIQKEVEEKKKSEIFNAAHSKNEKLVCEKLGLNYDDYKDTEARGRVERILEDAAKKYQLQVEEVKNQFKGVDQDKLKEVENSYQKRLTETSEQYEARVNELQQQLDAELNQKKQIIVDNYKSSIKHNFLKSLENPAFDFDTMNKLVEFESQKYGIEIEEVNGEKVAFMVNSDGAKVAHPKKPQANLTYKDYIEIIAEENKFVKVSNGGSGKTLELSNDQKEALKKRGMGDKALAEREKHLANLQNK